MPQDEFDFEPVRGLPERPPEGEDILWQGRPDALELAKQSLLLYWVAGYFCFLALWRFATVVDIKPLGLAISAAVPFLLLGVLVCALLYIFALIQARATVYTLTSSRVVMRIGAALTVTFNIPFRELGNASLDLRKSGVGTIALQTTGKTRLSYLVCWPHVRPWRMNPTEPALRCIPDAARVAQILAEAAETRINTPRVALQAVAAE